VVERIISGGQTGADRAALDFAIAHGIPHGGWCPRGRKAEDGRIDGRYQLKETPSSSYILRTERNVRDSDGTVVLSISAVLTGGSNRTVELARKHEKPCLHLSATSDGDNHKRKHHEGVGICTRQVGGFSVIKSEMTESAAQYITCHCQHCGGGIEFPKQGIGQQIPCPHCGAITTLERRFSRHVLLAFAAIILFGVGATLLALHFKHASMPSGILSQKDQLTSGAKTETIAPDTQVASVAEAESGDVAAQDSLPRNSEEAVKSWLNEAAQGNADALFSLGQSFYAGSGVEKDLRQAVKWYRLAAEQGYDRAQYNLGICYDNGSGVAQNEIEAAKWIRRAAEQGDALSEYALAVSYHWGKGITSDSIEAYKWYSLALASGLDKAQMLGVRKGGVAKEAAKYFQMVKSQMTAIQIEEGRKRAQAFIPCKPSPVAPTQSLDAVMFTDPSHAFEIRVLRILIGQRTVDEGVFHQFALNDFRSRNKEVVYFEVSLKNIDGPQEWRFWQDDFSLQDKQGNTYSCEQTIDYIRGSVLRRTTARGGIAFAVEKGSTPTTLTYDTGYVYAGTDIKMFAKAFTLDRLGILKQPVGSDQ
jgi:TPR repeat protein